MKNKREKWIKTITLGMNQDQHKEKYIKHKYFNDPIKRLLCQDCKSTIIHVDVSTRYCRYHYSYRNKSIVERIRRK